MQTLIISMDKSFVKLMDYNDYIRPHIQVHEIASESSKEITLVSSIILDIVEEVRVKSKQKVNIACMHRSITHNERVKSGITSTHILGCGIDFWVKGYTSAKLQKLIKEVAKKMYPDVEIFTYAIGYLSTHFDIRLRVMSKDGVNGLQLGNL